MLICDTIVQVFVAQISSYCVHVQCAYLAHTLKFELQTPTAVATSQNHIRAKMFFQCIAIRMHTEFKMPISKIASYSWNSHPIIYTQCS